MPVSKLERFNVIAAIIKYEIRQGREAEFQEALGILQARVQGYEGYLGEEPCKNIENENIFFTVFYWRDQKSMNAWRADPEHRRVQQLGKDRILKWYEIKIALVEREYHWGKKT